MNKNDIIFFVGFSLVILLGLFVFIWALDSADISLKIAIPITIE